jgi:uncharacterized protein (TIGR03437 family)
MKYLALSLLTVGLCFGQEFVTGQAARLVIGQTNFTRQQPGTSATVLGSASGLAYANGTLFVVDSNRIGAFPQNNRILIYRDVRDQLPQPESELPSPPTSSCQVCGGVADTVLGQPDFEKNEIALSQTGMRIPTAVATDGRIVVVADTDNNRVLIWNSIPTRNGQPADVVLGQTSFTAGAANAGGGRTPNARGFRGPQGVWIQDGKLFVADTQNHRVMIWNQIPTSNGAEANVVLGQPDFTTFVEPNLLQLETFARANNMLNPVSVTSDGTRLYVSDLGYNRVLVWNTIPTSNQAPADFALGQPDVQSSDSQSAQAANNSRFVCESNGTNSNNEPTYPGLCSATLNFPRFALSDGRRLFVADGGNSRVLVWNTIPTRNGQPADVILGQAAADVSDEGLTSRLAATDALRTPLSLAWDGMNLYVSDPYDRRIMVFSLGDASVVRSAVRNAASREVYAIASVTVSGTVRENDEVTLTIAGKDYKYKAVANDNVERVINGLVNVINADGGDANVLARPNIGFQAILLTARKPGEEGNAVTLAQSVTTGSEIVLTLSSSSLGGGRDAARIAPGSLITVLGSNLADQRVDAPTTGTELPTTLGGVQVYANGQRLPLMMVSPSQITAQMPFEVSDTTSVSLYVRRVSGGSPRISNAIGIPIVATNPGIFAEEGTDPRRAIALHGSSSAQGLVSVDGTIRANDVAIVTIQDREYRYTVKAEDTLETVRNGLIELINQDPEVFAYPASQFTRIRIQARTPGTAGNGIALRASTSDGAQVLMTAFNTQLCCANIEGAPVTLENPAAPGEVIIIYATGLGTLRGENASLVKTGQRYEPIPGVTLNTVIDDVIAGGRTAQVVFAGLRPGDVGVYEVHILLNSDIPTNELTQITIAQDIFVSNIVTIPVVNPTPPEE